MAARNVLTKQNALKLAGERRRDLDRARGEQDKRIEQVTAATLIAFERRDDAERALVAAQAEVGESVRQILAEDVSVDRAAALLDVDPSEVRQMMKSMRFGPAAANKTETSAVLAASAGSGPPHGERADRQVDRS